MWSAFAGSSTMRVICGTLGTGSARSRLLGTRSVEYSVQVIPSVEWKRPTPTTAAYSRVGDQDRALTVGVVMGDQREKFCPPSLVTYTPLVAVPTAKRLSSSGSIVTLAMMWVRPKIA